jgi:hypothetical protein
MMDMNRSCEQIESLIAEYRKEYVVCFAHVQQCADYFAYRLYEMNQVNEVNVGRHACTHVKIGAGIQRHSQEFVHNA